MKHYPKHLLILAVLVISAFSFAGFKALSASSAEQTAATWWPVQNAKLSGTQPFKGVVTNLEPEQYVMYWSVDNGALNKMDTNYNDGPHKEAMVNVSGWKWRAQGPYVITYIAKDSTGKEIARTSFDIINTDAPAVTTEPPVKSLAVTEPSSTVAKIPTPIASEPDTTKPLYALNLYADPSSSAKQQADSWKTSRPTDAAQMNKIASYSQAKWFGGWNSDVAGDAAKYTNAAQAQNKAGVIVAYNIPQRDCGGYSAGGTSSGEAYLAWIKGLASGIGSNKAVVMLEPDAVAGLDCLNVTDQANRLSLLSQAVTILKANPSTYVYLDAGHPRWKTVDLMATRLGSANIKAADGFSLNISNFIKSSENVNYGQKLSAKLAGKHFVIDTSRNGNGPTTDNQWCNPVERALGEAPTTQVANPLVDAYLWIKAPGESDGSCNEGPSAGTWWPEYALGLAQRASY